ncbi:MAG TPA: ABC transporter permease, partial [Desulfitobacteriaceae bacterium]|nr:ABC transporter permease [Desulfitobacteriaceae bacterium]
MVRYLFGRIVSAVFVVWFVVTLTFILMHSIPGGPFSSEKVLPPAIAENINKRYHLNDPLLKQYLDYLKNMVFFDFGPTYRYQGRSVNDLLQEGFPKTAALGLSATVLALFGGITMGVMAALKQNKMSDYIIIFLATIGVSVPSFVLATFLQYYVGYKLHWFPPLGWGETQNLVLPVIALSAYPVAQIARLTRTSMLDVLTQDYIRTAKAKGLAISRIIIRHVLKNALAPVVT